MSLVDKVRNGMKSLSHKWRDAREAGFKKASLDYNFIDLGNNPQYKKGEWNKVRKNISNKIKNHGYIERVAFQYGYDNFERTYVSMSIL